ncbi:hypothetical protein JCM10213_001115 [Rhodosporidiobolus nylandii]
MPALLEFRAGRCTRQGETNTVVPEADRGLISLEEEDGLLHFYYRSLASPTRPILDDLIIFPGDASFVPVPSSSPAAGRVHVLKFNSSSARHFFWHQDVELSREEYERRARRVNELIGGEVEDVNPAEEAGAMDVEANPTPSHSLATPSHATTTSTSGAPGAPPTTTSTAAAGEGGNKAFGDQSQLAQLQSILATLGGAGGAGAGLQGLQGLTGTPEFLLPDVLPPQVATSLLSSLPPSSLQTLSTFLPPSALLPTSTESQQRASLARALSSPEFRRSLSSLDRALRTGATGPMMQGLGMSERAAQGTGEFLEEVQRQADEQKAREGEGREGDGSA